MFEISQLKEKKLSELQDIAKELNMTKFKSLKKLIWSIKSLIIRLQIRKSLLPKKQIIRISQKPQRKRRERVQRPKDNSPQKSIDFKEQKKDVPKAPTKEASNQG